MDNLCFENKGEKINPIKEIVRKQKQGKSVGIYSCCSANIYVLKAAMQRAKKNNTYLLLESTANQVNQDEGYTGMKPSDFYKFAKDLADKEKFPEEFLLLGGDHLGPLIWTNLNAAEAMGKAAELVRQYVEAGFTKIHIDTSMKLADDNQFDRLNDGVIAERGAFLCEIAEKAYEKRRKRISNSEEPVYIIGSEVPIPGGVQDKEEIVSVTSPDDCEKTIRMFHMKFQERNLEDAWDRVVGIVVQPGVEFGDMEVFDYKREKSKDLISYMRKNDKFILEGHSTDYQTKENLKRMVEDGIAILKVGPALTFNLREALFALENIEIELLKDHNTSLSCIRAVLETVMIENPKFWEKHYHGDDFNMKLSRAYSLSDRCRYYLNDQRVQSSINKLIVNLDSVEIPYAILKQYLPAQYDKVRRNELSRRAEELLLDHIGDCCDDYLFATAGE